MKKAFSLFEILIVLLLISILTTFIIMKSSSSLDSSISLKIKADVALIRDAITKQNAKQVLLNNETSFNLDSASIETKGAKLFENILDFPLISTDSTKKELGSWIKKSTSIYVVYLPNDILLEYEYVNFKFECKNSNDICEQFQ